MFLILVSLITGYLGMVLGSAIGLETAFGVFGFLSPTVFLVQKIYIKLESLPAINLPELDRSIENSNENEMVQNNYEVCPACGTKNNENEQYCTSCGLKLID